MRTWAALLDDERWNWFAAGDPALAQPRTGAPDRETSPQHVMWLAGLTLAIPLALAVALCEMLG
jgi:hypothetical protein